MGELYTINVNSARERPDREEWRAVLVRVADIVTEAGKDQ